MVKPSAPLLKSVALRLNARQEIEKQPSVAKDSGTPKRTAMHLLNKMVNNIRGLKEISAQTAAACVLGMPAETCTHEFHLAFVDAALKYLDELHADNKKGYRFYNKKCWQQFYNYYFFFLDKQILSEPEEFGSIELQNKKTDNSLLDTTEMQTKWNRNFCFPEHNLIYRN